MVGRWRVSNQGPHSAERRSETPGSGQSRRQVCAGRAWGPAAPGRDRELPQQPPAWAGTQSVLQVCRCPLHEQRPLPLGALLLGPVSVRRAAWRDPAVRTCSASFTSCQAVRKFLASRSLGLPICRRDNSVLTAQGRLRTESDIVRTHGQMVASRAWTPCGLPAAGCSTLPLCREGREDGAHKGGGWFQEDSIHPSGGATLARRSPFADSGAERRHSAGLWWVPDEHAARLLPRLPTAQCPPQPASSLARHSEHRSAQSAARVPAASPHLGVISKCRI